MKVNRIRAKRVGDVKSQHSVETSLREHLVSVSICASKVERMVSFRQRRSKDGDSDAIACAYRLREELEKAARGWEEDERIDGREIFQSDKRYSLSIVKTRSLWQSICESLT